MRDESRPVHIEYLMALSSIDDDNTFAIVEELIYVYLETAPSVLLEIQNAVQSRDYQKMQERAAKLQFGSERIGARRLASACTGLVKLTAPDSNENLDLILLKIRQEFAYVEKELTEIVNGLTSSQITR
jgi:HPt (histidine-containing phosphotransfer) domain-containing protein